MTGCASKLAQSREGLDVSCFVAVCGAGITVWMLQQCLVGECLAGTDAACGILIFAVTAVFFFRRRLSEQKLDAAFVEDILAACRAGDFVLADRRLSLALPSLDGAPGTSTSARLSASVGQVGGKPGIHSSAKLLVEACLEAGDAQLAAEWFKRLHAAGLRLGAKRLLDVLTALAEKEFTSEAKEFFLQVLAAGAPADFACYRLIFDRCTPPGDAGAIEVLLQHLKGRRRRDWAVVFVALLRSGAQTKDGRQAEGWMSRAIELGVPAHWLQGALLISLAHLGETEKAEHWLEKMEEAGSSAQTQHGKASEHMPSAIAIYTAIMRSCVRHGGETQRAEAWFERMLAAGVRPDAMCFRVMLKAYVTKGALAGAERWLQMAREQRVSLGVSAYFAVADCAARAFKPERAEWWLREAISDGLEANASQYNILVSSLVKTSGASRAQRLVALMCERGVEPTVETLAVALDSCAKAGDLTGAEAIFEQIVSRGQVRPDATACNALVNAAVQAGNVTRAEHWLASMRESGVALDVRSHTMVLHAHARAGNIEMAERGFQRMLADGFEAHAASYTCLIRACAKAADGNCAEEWFHHMQAAGIQATAVQYGALLNVFAKAHDFQRAERWFARMRKDSVAPSAFCYNQLIEACAKAGHVKRAESWLRRLMGAKGRMSPDLVPTGHSFITTARAYAVKGRYNDVCRLLAEMEEWGITMGHFGLAVLLFAYSRARPCQVDLAKKAFRHHVERGLPVNEVVLRTLRTTVGNRCFQELLAESPVRPVSAGPRNSAA